MMNAPESTSLTFLACRCREVANNPSAYTQAVSDEAAGLVSEFASLERPPPINLKEQQEMAAKLNSLKSRMYDFLAARGALAA